MRGWLLLERLCPAAGALRGCVGLPPSRCRAGSPGQSAALFRLGIHGGDAPCQPRALGRKGDTVRGFSPGLCNGGVCLFGFSCAGGGKIPQPQRQCLGCCAHARPGARRWSAAAQTPAAIAQTPAAVAQPAFAIAQPAIAVAQPAVQPLPSHTRPLPSATLKRRFLALRAKLPSPFRRAGAAGAARMGGVPAPRDEVRGALSPRGKNSPGFSRKRPGKNSTSGPKVSMFRGV